MDFNNIKYGDEFILVVDDDEFVSQPNVEMLRHLGFQAESASNGEDALKALKEKPFTFLLTDIKMPGMNGLELIQKTKDGFPQVSTIAMTGYSQEYSYIDVINSGATDFITKPFGIEELEAKIRRAIIERHNKNELIKLSITDSLTGLYNQRHLFTRLKDEISRTERQKYPLGLILIDIDDFKQYNDTHGHLEGDKLLQTIGRIIKTNIRQDVDSGYRYGGDEFAIILIDAGSAFSHSIENRIKELIFEECHISVSTGYGQYLHGLSHKEFMAQVDTILYKAKDKKIKIESN